MPSARQEGGARRLDGMAVARAWLLQLVDQESKERMSARRSHESVAYRLRVAGLWKQPLMSEVRVLPVAGWSSSVSSPRHAMSVSMSAVQQGAVRSQRITARHSLGGATVLWRPRDAGMALWRRTYPTMCK